MARKKKVEPIQAKTLVKCADCRFAVRDTEGISRNHLGEYYMCRCTKGHSVNKWGELSKLFINHLRDCGDFKTK